MGRHSFCQQNKLHNVMGRIDYISDPKRQEHLYATYSTVEGRGFWKELAKESRREFKKYNCEGKCVEAREWIIALDETLVYKDPDAVLQVFADIFKERYGVECIAALHHNKDMTNYHIHMIFSDRKLLDEPIVKRAERRMYYDENGKHSRTKKAVCDENGKLREGCTVIEKGEIYEQTLFSGKEQYFKSREFNAEAKQIFTDVNNGLINDKEREQQVFDKNSVYLPTKKIGKNNPKAGEIKADNAVRQDWNRAADAALVSGVPEASIFGVKYEKITEPVQASIVTNGNMPALFSEIVMWAAEALRNLTQRFVANEEEKEAEKQIPDWQISEQQIPHQADPLPKKPKLTVDMDKFKKMQETKESLDTLSENIRRLSKRIKQKENYMDKLTYPWKKIKALKELSQLVNERSRYEESLESAVKEAGHSSVQKFMKAYRKAEVAIKKYNEEYAVYKKAVEEGRIVEEAPPRSISAKLEYYKAEVKKVNEHREIEIGVKKIKQKNISL